MASSGKKQNRRRGKLTLTAAVLLLGGAILWMTLRQPVEPEPPAPSLPKNPYAQTEFVFDNGFLNAEDVSLLHGIDVSSHQGSIDWPQAAEAGVEFAMIRVGYRGYDLGDLHIDSQADVNYREAGEAGLQRGVYIYSQAVSPEEAVEEANFVLEFLDGRVPELPVVFDWEYVRRDARTGACSRECVTDCALAFCQTIAQAGLKPMVYFNQDLAGTRLELAAISGYDFWLAQYGTALTYPVEVSMWQYSDKGTVPGITGAVDLDLLFLDTPAPNQ